MDVNKKDEEEEIPYLTVKSDEEYSKIREKLRWKPTNYKIVQFSINDLLRAEKIENTNRFLFKDTDFRSVKIKGSVVGKESRSTGTLIKVDDGTAQIDCIFQSNKKLNILNGDIDMALNSLISEPESQVDKGMFILLTRCKNKLKKVPLSDSDLHLGDSVIVVGNMSEAYEQRGIYIQYLSVDEKSDLTVEIQHLKNMYDLYAN